MNVKLQVYETRCKLCRHRFEHLVPPQGSYGLVPVSNANQSIIMLVPFPKDISKKINALAAQLSKEVDLRPSTQSLFADQLLVATLDPLPSNEKWYIWGRIPCPFCKTEMPDSLGPVSPLRTVDREVNHATQNRWGNSSADEHTQIARTVLQAFKNDWHFTSKSKRPPT